MKKFQLSNLFVFALAVCSVKAQQIPYIPVDNYFPQGPGTQTVSYPFGITAPTSAAVPDYVAGSMQVNFIAGQRVQLHDGFHAGGFTGSGYFRAQIGTAADFDVAFMEPNQNTPDVGQYEKLEMGIHLPQQLFDDVEGFCNHTPNYPTPVNPFNPEELNVYAEFYRVLPNNTDQLEATVYGFYYREFERARVGNHADWDWNPVNTDYTFRVRFAPSILGQWKVVLKVESATRGNYQVGTLQFSCVGSSDPNNKGFVKTLHDKRYLELGNTSFMPIGWNISNPIPRNFSDYRFGCGPYGWNSINEYGYEDFKTYLQELSDAGGNYFRLHTDPWALEIEFEHLNDYSNRLTNAWEMDRILDEARDLNLYIHFTLFGGNAVIKGGSYWDWSENSDGCTHQGYFPPDNGYCYHTQLGLTNPSEFLTDPQAKKFFKYRLRYMISRYGYSRNIALFELANEVNNFCQEYTPDCNNSLTAYPYGDSANIAQTNLFRAIINNWQSEMTSYIKTQLYSENHILTVNYANNPETGDNSFGLSTIDMSTFNYYNPYLNRIGHYFDSQRDYGYPRYGRPFFFSETGESNRDVCSNFTEWIRSFWTVPFSGAAGGLNWPKTSIPDNISVYSNFARLRDYIAGINFNDGDWEPDYQLRNDFLAETIHVKHFDPNRGADGSFDKAIGVVLNRTYNDFTMRTCFSTSNCACGNYDNISDGLQMPNASIYTPVQDVNYDDVNIGRLKVTGMGALNHYSIEWMDVLTGNTILYDDKFSQLDGDLVLEFPTLFMQTLTFHPILAFKIYPYNGSLNRISSSSIAQQSQLNFNFTIYPIPAANKITIIPGCETCVYNVQFTDVSGKIILMLSNQSGIQSLDVSSLANGVYFVTFISGDMIQRKKILIAKQ
jgi:hypothetical protein